MPNDYTDVHDRVLDLQESIERLMSGIYDTTEPINKEDILRELKSLDLKAIHIRQGIVDTFCQDEATKQALMQNMEAKEKAIMDTAKLL